ncbi:MULTISPECIES: MspA family porin [Tsukamurella]|uniref:MspA family porin n=2 Tax=Tsukamurella TaxID=2060 RepID=A0A5C5S4H7_9ACTN|nr:MULTISPECIES: MspA family porin [Tsukamurella]NMD55080.1 MspA family porin [Tsukamurella columbiensis]TWS30109.1 MspA family porin [Tsukamurella conjunctivitidis]
MKNIAIRGAVVAAAAGVALGTVSTGVANADTFIPLPNGSVSNKVGDSNVVVSITNQSAKLSPGMVALPTTRNAWVSGLVSVKINGGKPDGGSIAAGYAVGCQVDVGSAGVTAGVTGDSGASIGFNGPTIQPKVTAKTGASIKLSAGSIGTQMLTYDRATWPSPGDEIAPDWADPSTGFKFKGASGSLAYTEQTIGVDGCAGYAQARFFAKVKVKSGNTQSTVFLWGKPFTLG